MLRTRPATRTHLVTGATGLVGGALVLELLDRSEDRVVALVRPGRDGNAHDRLVASLREAAAAYGRDPDSIPMDRVSGLAGDITQPGCAVADTMLHADTIWHSAASLRYEDRYAEEISAINVTGTQNVIALARRCGARGFNMVSTAYVSGAREGHLLEVERDDSAAQNHYERSKVRAEFMVRACGDMDVRIFRPSVVVGHSRTLAVTTFSGLYGFTRRMMQYRGVLERLQKGLSRRHQMKIRASARAQIDLIPVDAVAAQAVHIGLRPETRGIYHLTQPNPPTVGETITAIATGLGYQAPEFVGDDVPLEYIDKQFDKGLEFYSSYIRGFRRFDRSRTDAALMGARELAPAVPPVGELVGWYAQALERQRQSLPASR